MNATTPQTTPPPQTATKAATVQAAMRNGILVNGQRYAVGNVFSSGPNAPIHTYELRGHLNYLPTEVRRIGNEWTLSREGCTPRTVTVEVVR